MFFWQWATLIGPSPKKTLGNVFFFSIAHMLTFSHEFFFSKTFTCIYMKLHGFTQWLSVNHLQLQVTCPKLGIYIYTDGNEKFYSYTSVSKFQILIYTYTKDMFKTIYTHTHHQVLSCYEYRYQFTQYSSQHNKMLSCR